MIMNFLELQERIERNYRRLNDDIYQIHRVFQPKDYSWPGDWEGRSLLSFVCHYRMTGREIPCMHQMVELLLKKTDGRGYFGPAPDGLAREQQLSGHSWYLRGLVAYDRVFPTDRVKGILKTTFETLYLTAQEAYIEYPLEQDISGEGGVSGTRRGICGHWELSTDVGCAFMAVDGVSDYYEHTGDPRAKALLEMMIPICMSFDRIAVQAQTHASLSAARGILRFYRCTGEERYLQYAKDLLSLYERDGMTLTYENYNWFGRPLWTEPCCVVDSLILSTELYTVTKDPHYLTLAKRILHNGFAFLQRSNGGAGTDSCVHPGQPYLYIGKRYEAYFCCTMRLAEGLLCAYQNRNLLLEEAEEARNATKDEFGRYFWGDVLLCEDISTPGVTDGYQPKQVFQIDGKQLVPLLPLYLFPEEKAKQVKLRILF